MDPKRWSKAVTVETGKVGKLRAISSTAEAAEFLLERWPVEGSELHLRARFACLSVLEGEEPPEHARQAFIKAAEEAGIFVRSQ